MARKNQPSLRLNCANEEKRGECGQWRGGGEEALGAKRAGERGGKFDDGEQAKQPAPGPGGHGKRARIKRGTDEQCGGRGELHKPEKQPPRP
jgi:hypothetical protein